MEFLKAGSKVYCKLLNEGIVIGKDDNGDVYCRFDKDEFTATFAKYNREGCLLGFVVCTDEDGFNPWPSWMTSISNRVKWEELGEFNSDVENECIQFPLECNRTLYPDSKLTRYCVDCGAPIPDGQDDCAMCYVCSGYITKEFKKDILSHVNL